MFFATFDFIPSYICTDITQPCLLASAIFNWFFNCLRFVHTVVLSLPIKPYQTTALSWMNTSYCFNRPLFIEYYPVGPNWQRLFFTGFWVGFYGSAPEKGYVFYYSFRVKSKRKFPNTFICPDSFGHKWISHSHKTFRDCLCTWWINPKCVVSHRAQTVQLHTYIYVHNDTICV